MSRIGKQTITIPEKTEVVLEGGRMTVKGPLGELSRSFKTNIIAITIGEDKVITLVPVESTPFSNALWGTYASHIQNMITGVNTPYEKKLVIEGVGYRGEVSGTTLVLNVGFSHQVTMPIPEGLTVTMEKNVITISGIDKEMVGAFAANVRLVKKPEPYKGKGIRYHNEVVRRKQGKKTA